MTSPLDTEISRREIEDFLYTEASYLDQGDLDQWLTLFTEDAKYWIPVGRETQDPNKHVSIIYDDRTRLEERVWRIKSGLAYAQEPRSLTQHVISNVRVLESTADGVLVGSSFVVAELRRGIQTMYAGRFQHRLRWQDGSWKIAEKKVELLNGAEALGNLSFIF